MQGTELLAVFHRVACSLGADPHAALARANEICREQPALRAAEICLLALDEVRGPILPMHRNVSAPGEPHMCSCGGTANCPFQ